LGKRLDRFDRLPEQAAAMDEICAIADAEQVDCVLIAGDLYDTFNPPTEATELFYRTLHRLSKNGRRAVIAIAGNHDSPDRIEAPDPLARACGIILVGFPHSQPIPFALESGLAVLRAAPGFVELQLPGCAFPLRLLLTPYANEGRIRKDLGHDNPAAQLRELLEIHWRVLAEEYCDHQGLNLMVAHLLMMSEGDTPPDENSDEEKAMGPTSVVHTQNLPEGIQYAALGHIHNYRNMTGGPCPAVYASSPIAFSFPSRGQNNAASEKFVVIIEGEPSAAIHYRPVALHAGLPLLRRQFSDVETALPWLRDNQDCYVELHIETATYLTAEERKQLSAAHPRIVGPIPIFKAGENAVQENARAIDLQLSREELFRRYFFQQKGVQASDELLELFREVAGKEVEA
jgi:DNA repair protein SbcD/Mre11